MRGRQPPRRTLPAACCPARRCAAAVGSRVGDCCTAKDCVQTARFPADTALHRCTTLAARSGRHASSAAGDRGRHKTARRGIGGHAAAAQRCLSELCQLPAPLCSSFCKHSKSNATQPLPLARYELKHSQAGTTWRAGAERETFWRLRLWRSRQSSRRWQGKSGTGGRGGSQCWPSHIRPPKRLCQGLRRLQCVR